MQPERRQVKMSNKFFVFVSYFRIIVFIMCVICYAFFACKKKGIILSGDNIMVEKMKLLIKDYNIPINIVINIFAVFVFWCCLKGEIIPGIKDLPRVWNNEYCYIEGTVTVGSTIEPTKKGRCRTITIEDQKGTEYKLEVYDGPIEKGEEVKIMYLPNLMRGEIDERK